MGKASRGKRDRAERPALSTASVTSSPHPFITRPLTALILLALLAALVYSNTFSSPFYFDDIPNIVENPQIKNLANFTDLSGTRYVGYLSFALNYHFGRLNVFGYHLVNLLIHIANGFLVYSLVLLLGRAIHGSQLTAHSNGMNPSAVSGEPSAVSPLIALATALLFIAHPIQTQSVTYIVQRFASLVTLFYLLTVVCYLKWRLAAPDTRGRYLWYTVALLSTILAMKTKENSFTLPLMILLVEFVFFRPLTKRRWLTLIPFLLTLSIIPLSQVNALGEAEGFARETTEIGRLDYLFTQFRVIVTYLRLLVLPINQNLDYDYPIYHSLFETQVFFSSLLLLALFALALFLLLNSRLKAHNSQLIAFGILWFFLTLSIESSIIPIRDVIFEHRLYLPSLGAILAVSVTLLRGHFRAQDGMPPGWIIGTAGVVTLVLGFATYQRNSVWQDELTLRQDVVAKAPKKARAHLGLGYVFYAARRQLDQAISEYQTALRLQPNYVDAHINLASVYEIQGRLAEAAQEAQAVLKLMPNHVMPHIIMGNVHYTQGRLAEAAQEYETAIRLEPDFAIAHYQLGVVYKAQGRLAEAFQEAQAAVTLRPDYPQARSLMGEVHYAQGRLAEAVQEYRAALRLHPAFVDAHNNLGAAYADQGRLDEAILEYQKSSQLQPNHPVIRYNLGRAYILSNRFEEAIRELQAALSLRPDHAETHYYLGVAYKMTGRREIAGKEFERVLELQPKHKEARHALESLSQEVGAHDEVTGQ